MGLGSVMCPGHNLPPSNRVQTPIGTGVEDNAAPQKMGHNLSGVSPARDVGPTVIAKTTISALMVRRF